MTFNIALLAGDGIGPEVVAEGVRVLEAIGHRYGHDIRFQEGLIGGCAIDKHGTALPSASLKIARGSDAILLGAVGGPKWDDPQAKVRPEDGLLAIRKSLALFANLRPVKVFPELAESSPLRPAVLEGVDFVVVRELTGGLYFGKPKRRWITSKGQRRGVDTMAYSEEEVRRVLRVGFELAQGRRKKLTSVDKANVLETSRLWREVAVEVSSEYPDVTLEHLLVDTVAMQLVQSPNRFDVVVTENTFGDILTDEAAVLAGSMGMLASASLAGIPQLGTRALGLYEPVHGSAPDIAGQSVANPLATILSTAMLFRYSLGLETEATVVENAVAQTIAAGCRSAELVSPGKQALSTQEMANEVIARL